jgi:NAD(P)-dependent dehydrogenase (short-subunit alcohol dehydrogenase family)
MMNYSELFSLKDKVSLVTGAGKGLGKAMAEALAQAGSKIIVADIDKNAAEETAKMLETTYDIETLAVDIDITNENDVIKMVDTSVNQFGKIDVLLNNAGICQKIKMEDMSLEDWKKTMDVNVNGVFLVSKYAGKKMMENKSGSIINIASMSSFIANTEAQCAYNAAKAAVAMMTKCMASEWVSHNIRVNAIAPGYMKTEMTKPIFEPGGELAHVLDLVPMKRLGEPYELGGLAIYLASDASTFATGSVFKVDGGYTVW